MNGFSKLFILEHDHVYSSKRRKKHYMFYSDFNIASDFYLKLLDCANVENVKFSEVTVCKIRDITLSDLEISANA